MLSQFILPAITFGLTAVTIPGPFQAFLINTALTLGWCSALWVVIVPLISDIPIILLVVFLLGQLPDSALQVITLLGGCLLLWIGWGALKQYRAGASIGQTSDENSPQIEHTRSIFFKALGMNFLSPGPYLFWSTVLGPILLDAMSQSPIHVIAFLISFYVPFLGGNAIVAFLIARVGGINENFTRFLMLLTIILLFGFGVGLIFQGVGGLL